MNNVQNVSILWRKAKMPYNTNTGSMHTIAKPVMPVVIS